MFIQYFKALVSFIILFQISFAQAADFQCTAIFTKEKFKNSSNVNFDKYNFERSAFDQYRLVEDKLALLQERFDSASPEAFIAFLDSILGRDYYLQQFVEHKVKGKKDSFFSYKNSRSYFLPHQNKLNQDKIDRIILDLHDFLVRLTLKDNWTFTPKQIQNLRSELEAHEKAAYDILKRVEAEYWVTFNLPKSDVRKNRLNLLSWVSSIIPLVLHPLQRIKLNFLSYDYYKNGRDIFISTSILVNHYLSITVSRAYKTLLLFGFGVMAYSLANISLDLDRTNKVTEEASLLGQSLAKVLYATSSPTAPGHFKYQAIENYKKQIELYKKEEKETGIDRSEEIKRLENSIKNLEQKEDSKVLDSIPLDELVE